MKRSTTMSPKTIATANTPRSLTERWVGNIMKRCSIIATALLQNNRTRMLLYKNLQKELQILKRFCTCSGRFVPVFFKLGRLAGGAGRGGGDTHFIYVPPTGQGFCAVLVWKKVYRLCQFCSGIGYGFLGNFGSVWTYLFFQFQNE